MRDNDSSTLYIIVCALDWIVMVLVEAPPRKIRRGAVSDYIPIRTGA